MRTVRWRRVATRGLHGGGRTGSDRKFARSFGLGLSAGVVSLGLGAQPALASGSGLSSLVSDIAFCLALAGLLAVCFVRFGIPTIGAFIVTGIIAGPLGLARVTDPANIDTIAQLGFILLLFTIGLEIDLKGLKQGGRVILVAGLLQFPLTLLFGYGAAKLLALSGLVGDLVDGRLVPLYIGAAIAGSSTLLVVKLFQDAFELDTVPGRVSLGILIFQDLWAIVLIVLQPSLDAPKLMPVVGSFVGIAIMAFIAAAFARLCLGIALKWVARSPETVVIAAVAWCFFAVLMGQSLDVLLPRVHDPDLHLTVGVGMSALIAGVVLASLPHAHEIMSKVGVLKDFFVTLFFVSLGMSVPAPHDWNIPILALLIACIASLSRLVIFFPLLYLAGLDRRNATVTSIRLAQISEFGLVVVVLGIELGQLSREQGSAIVLAFVLTALATSPLYRFAYQIHEWLSPVLRQFGFKEPAAVRAGGKRPARVVLLGFHRVASALLTDIARDDPGLAGDVLVVDFNAALHDAIRAQGAAAEYGDFSRAETLLAAGLDSASVIVSTIPDDLMRGIDNRRLVALVRRINPGALIIANTVRLDEAPAIYAAGADYVYAGHVETARALVPAIHHALNGNLRDWADARSALEGTPDQRADVLR